MSDHDAAPDPVDKAYAEAEAMLGDDAARAARRARVLAAVAQEPAAPVFEPRTVRRPVWGRARWLAAASVAGLGVLIAAHLYAPVVRQQQIAPAASGASGNQTAAAAKVAAPEAAVRSSAAEPLAGLPPPRASEGSATAPAFAPPPAAAPAPARDAAPAAPPPPPAPLPPAAQPAPEAFPDAAAPPPPPPPSMSDVTVTAQRRAGDTAPSAAGRLASSAGLASDRSAQLRAAAAAGHLAEVKALLEQGVAVDAADAEGDTALMKSIEADQPTVAALLHRHGASLERRDHAGRSARDMAAAKDDAALNQILGLAP